MGIRAFMVQRVYDFGFERVVGDVKAVINHKALHRALNYNQFQSQAL